MFIALLRTVDNEISVETDTFSKALNTVQLLLDKSAVPVKQALVLETTEELDSICPDFSNCKIIVSLGVFK